jgi:hypothetical protein
MEIINLPKIAFSVETLQDIELNGQLKDNLDAVNYIFQYYYEIKGGMYYFYDVNLNSFEFKTDDNFTKEVLRKLNNKKKITDIIHKNNKIYQVVCKINKPRIFKENDVYYINETGSFLHQTYQKYDTYSNDIKIKVNRVLDMIKEVSCKNDENAFKALILYYAQIARGMKTEIIPVRKTTQEGIGKSTETEFFSKYVYGEKVSLLCNSTEPILTNFNKIFLGKLFIVLEDLPEFNDSQWKLASSRLKTYCTEKSSMYRDVYEKAVQTENISNFIITTNFTIRDSNGRRYKPLDLSLSKKGQFDYWASLRKDCFNNTIGEAFFSYLLTKITDEEAIKYYGQRDFPDTENKILAIANSLSSVYKFIKFNYILKNRGISKILRGSLYNEYEMYTETSHLRKCGKNDFFQKLEEVNIKAKKINGEYYYALTKEELTLISTNEKWICKYDDIEESNDEPTINDDLNSYEDIITEKNNQIEKLLKEVEELKNQIKKSNSEPEEIIELQTLLNACDKKGNKNKMENVIITTDKSMTADDLDDLVNQLCKF